MKRGVTLAVAAVAVVATGALLGPWARAAGQDTEKKIEKRIVIRHGGGGFLGVGLDDLEGETRGAKVRSVEPDSPADRAGIEKGDVIVRFDGDAVRSAGQLARLVRETPAGRDVAIEVTRAGATQKLSATIGEGRLPGMLGEAPGAFHFELPEPPEPPEPPEAPGPNVAPRAPHPPRVFQWRSDGDEDGAFRMLPHGRPRLGITFVDLGEQLAAYFKLAGSRGVLVTSVADQTPAAKAGVKAGDVVLELDGKKIDDGGDLRKAVAAADGAKEIVIRIQRDGRPLDLEVTLASPEPQPHAEAEVKR